MATSSPTRRVAGAAAWPMAAWAQQPIPTIGYLGASRRRAYPACTADFIQGLNEQGYVEGRNFEVLYRFADNRYDRLPALAADSVRRRVNVIIASGNPAAVLAAKQATAVIPIVFTTGVDPVEFGLVASFNRPGGNITGVSFLTTALTAKRLELLHEILPAATSIGFLLNPSGVGVEAETREAENAARILGVDLATAKASTPDEIEGAFGNSPVGGSARSWSVHPRSQWSAINRPLGRPAIRCRRSTTPARTWRTAV